MVVDVGLCGAGAGREEGPGGNGHPTLIISIMAQGAIVGVRQPFEITAVNCIILNGRPINPLLALL